MMAGCFHTALAGPFAGCFDEIVFAISDSFPDQRIIGPFRRAFGRVDGSLSRALAQPTPPRAAAADSAACTDDEASSLSSDDDEPTSISARLANAKRAAQDLSAANAKRARAPERGAAAPAAREPRSSSGS